MPLLVTGAAGFIGSHLCEALAATDAEVIGLDAFIPCYPRRIKERNLQALARRPNFAFDECDLRSAELSLVLDGVDVTFLSRRWAGCSSTGPTSSCT